MSSTECAVEAVPVFATTVARSPTASIAARKQLEPLAVLERRALARRAGDDEAVGAVVDEVAAERLERVVVDRARLVERRHDRGEDSAEHAHHRSRRYCGAWPGSCSSTARGTAAGAASASHWSSERRGHETWAPDLPCEEIGLTVRDYAAVVGPQPDAVVVGHSMGGLTIPLITARITVFLAALVPVDGAYSGLDPEFTGTQRDELGRSFWPDLETARARLYPDLGDDDAREAFDRLRPQAPRGRGARAAGRAQCVDRDPSRPRDPARLASPDGPRGCSASSRSSSTQGTRRSSPTLSSLRICSSRSREPVDALGELLDLPVGRGALEELAGVRPPRLGEQHLAARATAAPRAARRTLRSS